MNSLFKILFGTVNKGTRSFRNLLSGKIYAGSSYGFSDLLMYYKLIDEGIILQTDGSFLGAFWFRGPDVETSTDEELTVMSAQINRALITIGSGWFFHIDTIRYQSTNYTSEDESLFPTPLTRLIDEERRQIYEKELGHYENVYVISFTFKPTIDFGSKLGLFFRRSDGVKEYDYSYYLNQFKDKLKEIADYLSNNLSISQMNSQELLSYISWCITGDGISLNLPKRAGIFLKQYLASKDLIGGEDPKIGDKYIKTITIMGFPSEAYAGIVDKLNYVNFEYRWNTRFILVDSFEGNKIIDRISNLWYQKRTSAVDTIKMSLAIDSNIKVNQNAENQYIDAESAKAINDSGEARFGFYTSTIVITGYNKDEVERNAQTIRSELQQLGFESQIERHHSIEAYLGSLPGYAYANIRKWLIHTQNVADIVPNTSIWSGFINNPCPYYKDNNPPLFFARTTGYTPLRISLHTGMSGHSLIMGSSIFDKVTLMNFIIAQHFRYKNARVYVFDKNHTTLPLCYGCNGSFYDIGGEGNNTYFQPLANLENDLDFDFALTWIEELCILNKMSVEFNDNHRSAVKKALNLMREETPRERRTISYFRYLVQDFDRAVSDLLDAFSTENRNITSFEKTSGFKAKIFDSKEDFLSADTNKFNSFEMGKLMEIGDGVALPALRYLIHAISKQTYTGDPTLIVFNESIVLLKNPLIREKIIEWVKSIVTYNVAVLFTLDINEIAKYDDLKKELKTICNTIFFTQNNKAMTDDIYPLYKEMNLNSRQIEAISQLFSGQYLYLSDAGNRLFTLDIDKESATKAFTSNIETIKIKRAIDLYKQYGSASFAEKWLNECNVSNWQIEKLREYSNAYKE